MGGFYSGNWRHGQDPFVLSAFQVNPTSVSRVWDQPDSGKRKKVEKIIILTVPHFRVFDDNKIGHGLKKIGTIFLLNKRVMASSLF